MRRLNALYLLLVCLSLSSLIGTGCGSSNKNRNLPPSFSQITPNYGSDLDGVFYWPNSAITYRFVAPASATEIDGTPIPATAITADQATVVREAIARWKAALDVNATPGQRTFVEVAATDPSANIDIVMQSQDQFRSTSFSEDFGFTGLYFKDIDKGEMGRAVIRLRNNLSGSDFHYVTLHEFGHALGLNGHSRRFNTVMYPFQSSLLPVTELTTYDRKTIQANYTR